MWLLVIAFAMPFCYAVIDALGSFLDIFYLACSTGRRIMLSESWEEF
ncbi:MAG: hypothetical protein IKC46_06050 [Lachnospiraceae bacterium]|nr:hypothetical protein [Lachnospiraceae bacterium]